MKKIFWYIYNTIRYIFHRYQKVSFQKIFIFWRYKIWHVSTQNPDRSQVKRFFGSFSEYLDSSVRGKRTTDTKNILEAQLGRPGEVVQWLKTQSKVVYLNPDSANMWNHQFADVAFRCDIACVVDMSQGQHRYQVETFNVNVSRHDSDGYQ